MASLRPARWPTVLALLIAVIGVAVGIIGWFRPVPDTGPTAAPAPAFTDKQVAVAKARACNAFVLVDRATKLRTNLEPTDDPILLEAQRTDARLSLVAGGWYLRDHLDPATPAELATEIRKSADIMLDLAANALSGMRSADEPQATLFRDGNSSFDRIETLCK